MAATYIETREVPVHQLARFPGNAKHGNVEEIRTSIRRTGQYRSLVVRAHDGQMTILAGNHTHDAIKAEGHATARCEIIECTDDDARRINLADNRLAELGEMDTDALVELLSYLDGDYEGTGYDDAFVEALLNPGEEIPTALTDPDDLPEPPPNPRSALGDVWLLGPHRVLCGDSTDIAAVEAMLDGDRCHVMWTDPPYGVNYVGKTKKALTIQNDGAGDLADLLAGAFATTTAALQPGAALYVCTAPGPLAHTFAQAFIDAGWNYRQNLVWVKDVLVLGRSDYHYRHEPILYGYTPGEGRRGRGGDGWYGDNSQTTVLEVAKPKRSEDHPTMKPVELITRCLENSCPVGGLIYEPFGGSGSTLIAAHHHGASARVVELDPRYVDVICRRYQEHTGTLPILQSTGEEHDFTTQQPPVAA